MADKYKNLTEEEKRILDSFPTFSKQELDDINDMFKHYIFYKTVDSRSLAKRGRELWTSCCHKSGKFYPYLCDIMDPERYVFFAARHGAEVTCPYCGKKATLKCFNRKGDVNQYFNLVILHNMDGALFAQAYYVHKRLTDLELKPQFNVNSVFHFQIGRALDFWEAYGGTWNVGIEMANMKRRKNVREPFPKGGFGSGAETYRIIHPEALAESDLKYCGYFEHWAGSYERICNHYSLVRFLAAYCVYPRAMEMLLKNGFKDAVADLVLYGKKNAAAIKWDESDPRRAFGLTTNELKEFMSIREKNLDYIAAYKRMRKNGVKTSFSEIQTQSRELGSGIDFLKFTGVCLEFGTTPKRFINYLNRFTGGCHAGGYRSISDIYRHWTDYIEAAKEIGYDLEQEQVVFPANLEARHDEATAEHRRRLQIANEEKRRREELERAARDAEWAARHREQLEWDRIAREEEEKRRAKEIEKRRSRYTYAADGFIIRPAENAEEVIVEGQALQHCVAGYAERHMRGALTICFLRREDAPDTPLVTIEMSNKGELVQAHGFKNEREGSHITGRIIAPDPRKAYSFILEPWQKWVAGGSKRDKDGNPIIKKKKEVTAA